MLTAARRGRATALHRARAARLAACLLAAALAGCGDDGATDDAGRDADAVDRAGDAPDVADEAAAEDGGPDVVDADGADGNADADGADGDGDADGADGDADADGTVDEASAEDGADGSEVPPTCGDGIAEGPELCDGGDLAHRDCASFGWGGGDLACNGTCTFDDAACAPTVPVPRRPLNAAYVGSVHVPGSLRPEFSWEASRSPTGAAVDYEFELSDDPSFPAAAVVGVTTAATSHRPADDLPVATTPPVGRRYWWRVRACAGAICSTWSATRYLTAGASDRDLNGDGYADIAVSLLGIDASLASHAAVRIYFGGPTGPAGVPDVTLSTGEAGDDFGTHLAIVGDLNADGCADLAVTSTPLGGQVHVFFGAPVTGPDAVEDGLLDGGALGANWFGTWVGPAGDVNGDGYADLVVSASNRAGSGGSGALWVYLGGAGASFDPVPDGSASGESTTDVFAPAAGVGDVNGDGYADIAAAALRHVSPAGEIAGKVYLYHGGPGATFDGVADESVVGFAGTWSYFGNDLAGAGDVDDDGFADLLVGAWNDSTGGFDTGSVFLYRGGTGTVLDAAPDATFHGASQDNLGSRLAAGDVNGDGLPDLFLAGNQDGRPAPDQYAGALFAFLGGGWPPDTIVDAVRRGSAGGERFADTLAFAGDVDGDGFGDVVAGAPGDATGGAYAGAAYLFLGSAGATFDLVPDWTIRGITNDELGQSVY